MANLEFIFKTLKSTPSEIEEFSIIDMDLEEKLWEILDKERFSKN